MSGYMLVGGITTDNATNYYKVYHRSVHVEKSYFVCPNLGISQLQSDAEESSVVLTKTEFRGLRQNVLRGWDYWLTTLYTGEIHTSCSPSCTAKNSIFTVSEEPDGQHLQ